MNPTLNQIGRKYHEKISTMAASSRMRDKNDGICNMRKLLINAVKANRIKRPWT